MKTVRFKQVDVFTSRPFRGNPVAVVLEGAGYSDAEMQHIATWTNLSETTFVLPSKSADYRVRIFSPRQELPFAGHPTIGTAHAVLEAGLVKPKGGKFRQECGAGLLELETANDIVWVKAPAAKVSPVDSGKLAELERALGAKLVSTPIAVNVGPAWLVADMGSAETLSALKPDMQAVSKLTESLGITGVTAYGKSSDGRSAIHVRSFAPAHGIPEDPVCGSGNISVARFLMDTKQLASYGERYTARQGMQLGRDGEVSIRVAAGDIYLGGPSVTCVEGTLRLG